MTAKVLPSWREGATRTAILTFFDQVDQIPPHERVAVFDNDGTMWAEKPNYTQIEFWLAELRTALAKDASLADRPEFKAVLDGDAATLHELGIEQIAGAFLDLHTGITPESFGAKVADFFANFRHPERGVHLREARYQPMLELKEALEARGFDFYIVTGGGSELVRIISEEFYGVKPEGVVGSQIDYELVRDADGNVQLHRTNHVVASGINEGVGKPPNIQRILGRRPCVAGGNSAGDAEMLEYAMGYDGPSLALLVDHDDAEREYEYESVAGTFDSSEKITDTAARLGWVVASIKNDWSTVFAQS